MSPIHRRTIKLGGSLLDLDDLAPRIRKWLATEPPMQNVILVGGGRLADGIREAHVRHNLSEEAAHWLCVRILGITAEMVARLLPDSLLVSRLEDLLAVERTDRLLVFECERWLRDLQPSRYGDNLPHTWDVTSDSIAAALAVAITADELVLLKSRGFSKSWTSLSDAADAGYVDQYFRVAAKRVPHLRFVDFRTAVRDGIA